MRLLITCPIEIFLTRTLLAGWVAFLHMFHHYYLREDLLHWYEVSLSMASQDILQ